MLTTKKTEQIMQKNTEEETSCLDLEKKSSMPENLKMQSTSESLSKNVGMQLYRLMNQVTEDDINPQSVKAACHCAEQIYKILKFNLEAKKAGF